MNCFQNVFGVYEIQKQRFRNGKERTGRARIRTDEILSVIAAFKKRFLAVFPENSNLRGFPKGEASEVSDSYLVGAIV